LPDHPGVRPATAGTLLFLNIGLPVAVACAHREGSTKAMARQLATSLMVADVVNEFDPLVLEDHTAKDRVAVRQICLKHF